MYEQFCHSQNRREIMKFAIDTSTIAFKEPDMPDIHQ